MPRCCALGSDAASSSLARRCSPLCPRSRNPGTSGRGRKCVACLMACKRFAYRRPRSATYLRHAASLRPRPARFCRPPYTNEPMAASTRPPKRRVVVNHIPDLRRLKAPCGRRCYEGQRWRATRPLAHRCTRHAPVRRRGSHQSDRSVPEEEPIPDNAEKPQFRLASTWEKKSTYRRATRVGLRSSVARRASAPSKCALWRSRATISRARASAGTSPSGTRSPE